MGKRTNTSGFRKHPKLPKDKYMTWDARAYPPIAPFLGPGMSFWEPCAGEYDLATHIEALGPRCTVASDIQPGDERVYRVDALSVTREDIDTTGVSHIISNPPWTRDVLHRMIEHFAAMRPTWLLFDADWVFTGQMAPYRPILAKVVAVGRLRFIPGTKQDGTTNCAWHLFDARHTGNTEFIGRQL